MPTLWIFKSGSGRHQDLASLKSGTGCPSIPGGASHRPLQSRRERGREADTDGEMRKTGRREKGGLEGARERGEGRGGRGRKRVGREGSGEERDTERPRSTGRDMDRDKLRDRDNNTVLETQREKQERETRSMHVCTQRILHACRAASSPTDPSLLRPRKTPHRASLVGTSSPAPPASQPRSHRDSTLRVSGDRSQGCPV